MAILGIHNHFVFISKPTIKKLPVAYIYFFVHHDYLLLYQMAFIRTFSVQGDCLPLISILVAYTVHVYCPKVG